MKRISKKIETTNKSVNKTAKQVQSSGNSITRRRKSVNPSELIPTPCTPFNLECSGHVEGAFRRGTVINIIGDSHAGKSLMCLSILAKSSKVLNDRLIFDDVEMANEFDIGFLFGESVEERIETDIVSKTIEQLSDNIAKALQYEEPFIYVVDSADALTSEAAEKLAAENLKKRDAGNAVGGSYGDGKARAFSDLFKRHIQALKEHNSTLIIISQTRDNLGFGAQFNPKVRSCGKALKFYSSHEIWLAMQKKEKKGDRTYITNVQAKISKNKLTGRHGSAYFPILFDFGVDDITSCISFLIKEKYWSGDLRGITTNGFYPEAKISYQKLVKHIEDNDLEPALQAECKACYDKIMESMSPSHRKFQY